MHLSAFLVGSNFSSNLHIPLYYLTTPFPSAGDLDPPSVLSPGVLVSFVSSFFCTSLSLCLQWLIVLTFTLPHCFCSESLGFVCLPYLLLPSHVTNVSCFSCCASSSVAVPDLAQLLFLRLDALLAMAVCSFCLHTKSQGAEYSTLSC